MGFLFVFAFCFLYYFLFFLNLFSPMLSSLSSLDCYTCPLLQLRVFGSSAAHLSRRRAAPLVPLREVMGSVVQRAAEMHRLRRGAASEH